MDLFIGIVEWIVSIVVCLLTYHCCRKVVNEEPTDWLLLCFIPLINLLYFLFLLGRIFITIIPQSTNIIVELFLKKFFKYVSNSLGKIKKFSTSKKEEDKEYFYRRYGFGYCLTYNDGGYMRLLKYNDCYGNKRKKFENIGLKELECRVNDCRRVYLFGFTKKQMKKALKLIDANSVALKIQGEY